MRRATNPAITSQMYRHFATLTVILTAAVAVFANGESDQPAAARAADRPAVTREKPAKPAFREGASSASGDTGTWGSDSTNGFGSPTMSAPSSGSRWLPPPLAGINDLPRAADSDEPDDDSAGPEALTTAPVVPTAEQIAAAQAASRQRSGSAEGD